MMYTLWSRGELLGESALGYVRVYPNLRTGDLQVTQKGLTVIDRLTQARSDWRSTAKRVLDCKSANTVPESDMNELLADMNAAQDLEEAFAMELRGPDGSVIPTEDIYVVDTEYLLAIAKESESEEDSAEEALSEQDQAAVEEMLEEWEDDHPPWAQQEPEREPERFQIHVRLVDQWAIP
jgi:hypothetical protein